jgi:hypothetical protein
MITLEVKLDLATFFIYFLLSRNKLYGLSDCCIISWFVVLESFMIRLGYTIGVEIPDK